MGQQADQTDRAGAAARRPGRTGAVPDAARGQGHPSFSHLGTHVADIIEEAGRSAEKMLVDAADRAQEVVDEAEAEAAQIITAAEAQAGEIQGAARQDAEQLRVQGPGPRRRPVGRPRHSAPRPSGRPATCWRMPGRRPSSSGRRRSACGGPGRNPASGGPAAADPRAAWADARPPGVGPRGDPPGYR